MKTITYLIIAVMIAMTLYTPVMAKKGDTTTVTIKAEATVSPVMLEQSSKVISERLKAYGLGSCELKVNAERGEIKAVLPVKIQVSEIENLLTARGELAFYETCSGKDLPERLMGNTEETISGDVIAYSVNVSREIFEKADQLLAKSNTCPDHKLVWGVKGDKPMICLYVLKNSPVLRGSDIEKINAVKDADGRPKIAFNFNAGATAIWAEVTERNIGRSIAIVIDDRVLYDPVVRQAIKGGFCEITGDYTEKEVLSLVAIIGNGPLPVGFTIVK